MAPKKRGTSKPAPTPIVTGAAAAAQRQGHAASPPKTEEKDKKKRNPDTTSAEAEDPSKPKTWRESVWRDAWDKLSNDGEVHTDDLIKLLELSGQPHPQHKLAKIIAAELVDHPGLAAAQAFQFLTTYEAQRLEGLRKAYMKYAEDNGEVTPQQVGKILGNMGYVPLPYAIAEVIQEARELLGEPVQASADPEEALVSTSMVTAPSVSLPVFEKAARLLKDGQGFAKSELTRLRHVFHLFDADNSGTIDPTELRPMLVWLGLSSGQGVLENLFSYAFEERQGGLHFDVFLVVMRKHREVEYAHLQELFSSFDGNCDGCLDIGEFVRVFRWLGWSLDPDTLVETVDECNLDDDRITFTCFWRSLQLLRAREGFSRADEAEIRKCFVAHANMVTGELSTAKLTHILRELGHFANIGALGKEHASVSMDQRGSLLEGELLRFVRLHREAELSAIRKNFREYASQKGAGPMAIEAVPNALKKLNRKFNDDYRGVLLREVPLAAMPLKGRRLELDFDDFRRIVQGCRKKAGERFRTNQGFSDSELARFRIPFTTFSQDHAGGLVPPAGLAKVFGTVVPEMLTSTAVRERMRTALAAHQAERRGLDWKSFLKVMRSYEESLTDEREAQEADAVATLAPGQAEESEYREAFRSYGRGGVPALGEDAIVLLSGKQVLFLSGELAPLRKSLMEEDQRQNPDGNFVAMVSLLRYMMDDYISHRRRSVTVSSTESPPGVTA